MLRRWGCARKSARKRRGREARRRVVLAVRQRSAERAGARGVLELEKAVSCCSDLWRRTKLKVGSREAFDDLHGCTALGTAIQGSRIF